MRVYMILMIVIACVLPARAADVPGSKDHPLIKRYADSELYAYTEAAFDEYFLMVEPAANYGGKDKNLESTQALQGRVTERSYGLAAGRSTLEVFQNYRNELQAAGFTMIWECSNVTCGGRNFNHAVISSGGFAENYEDQRYLAARLPRTEGDLYVSLYVVRNYSVGGPTKNTIHVRLDTIELAPMESRMITVDAEAMTKSLGEDGHIALYGILFDTDKAIVKAESQPALQEIARLMASDPNMTLWVVGHTDNQGSAEYNQDLSSRRARAVVDALVKQFGVAPGRLQAAGVGFLAPVASNEREEGRALNRRVELVR